MISAVGVAKLESIAAGMVVTTCSKVAVAIAASSTASGAPVMSGLPIVTASVALSSSPLVGLTSV